MAKFIPDIKNLSLDDAKDTLDKSKIKYDDENIEERYSLLTRKGHVIETAPKIGSEVKKGDVVKLTVSKLCLLPFILMMAAFIIGLIIIEKNTFSNIFGNDAPIITISDTDWAPSVIISVGKDAKFKDGYDHYDVCILPDNDNDISKCNWIETRTKNIVLSESGIWHVYFRGVDKNGNFSKISKDIIAKVDNDAPSVDQIKSKVDDNYKLTIEVNSKDSLSGVDKTYYKINDGEYKEFKDRIEIENVNGEDKYVVTIKIVDEAGNEVEKTFDLSKKVHDAVKEIEERKKAEENGQNGENSNSDFEKNNDEFSSVGPIPSIDLDDVPSVIKGASNYSLPSHYDFGENLSGTYSCSLPNEKNKPVTSTSQLHLGTHIIACTIKNDLGYTSSIKKEVTIEIGEGEDEEIDGWIRYNIYYPDNSTNWEWRLDRGDTIRDGSATTDWQPYTGPIYIRIEDIQNIYIRYDLEDGSVTVPPKGKVLVDINPEKIFLKDGETTKVSILYDSNALTKEYRINGTEWKTYEGEFEVPVNTLIEARARKDVDYYDANGNFVRTNHLLSTDQVSISKLKEEGHGSGEGEELNLGGIMFKPNDNYYSGGNANSCFNNICLEILNGPTITSDPNVELSPSTTVTITTEEEADAIYYRINSGNFAVYTGPFTVSKNVEINAYYIRKSDYKHSTISKYYVRNIQSQGYPYVSIEANPSNMLSDENKTINISIIGKNYDKLEYSFDGIFYQKYTGVFSVTNPTHIYAKATNSVGVVYSDTTIYSKKASVPKERLEVSINASPSKEQVNKLIDETLITIDYDKRATDKYYRINDGDWKVYTGPFVLTENANIDAYCYNANAIGLTDYDVDFLTTGISKPIFFTYGIGNNRYQVTINYASTANIKKYRINGDEWLDYTEPIIVEGGSTIEAFNKDTLNNIAYNDVYLKPSFAGNSYISVIDKGDYYLIINNYPDNSEINSRYYKWKADGTWKSYPLGGWVLIKQSAKDKYDLTKGYITIENYSKQIVNISTEHVYVLDVPVDQLEENIYIKFDMNQPGAPVIDVDPEYASKSKNVAIFYNNYFKDKKYKIVKEDGTDTGWLDYTGPFDITDNNTTIYAKATSSQGVTSKISNYRITTIDKENPTITFSGEFNAPLRSVNVNVIANDNCGIESIKYLKGEHSVLDFKNDGTYIANRTSFKVTENGIYTVYVVDTVGNEIVKTIIINNIDNNGPNLTLNVLTEEFGTNLAFEADYGAAVTKQYRFGTTGDWIPYTGKVEVTSYDVLDKKNNDNSLTVSLRGVDASGNATVINEKVYVIDLEMPAAPIINAKNGYTEINEYGVNLSDLLSVTYDKTVSGLINEISLDGGATWKEYNGYEHVKTGTVKARSRRTSGLKSESSKDVAVPNNALGVNAFVYDDTKYVETYDTLRFDIDKTMWNEKLKLRVAVGGDHTKGSVTITFYDINGSKVGNSSTITSTADIYNTHESAVATPNNASYALLSMANGNHYSVNYKPRILFVGPYDDPVISSTNYYPKLTSYGMEYGYNIVTIDYFKTSNSRKYKIDDGEWKKYTGPIKLSYNQILYAQGTDLYGNTTLVRQYTSSPSSETLSTKAFDGNNATYVEPGNTNTPLYKYISIDSSMWNGKIALTTEMNNVGGAYGTIEIRFYDENNNEIGSGSYSKDGTNTSTYTIPNGTVTAKIGFLQKYNFSNLCYVRLCNVRIYDEPELAITKHRPLITASGIQDAYTDVNVNYFRTAVQKLFKINDGEFQNYSNTVKLPLGTKITAKSINNKSIESHSVQHTSTLISEGLEKAAFDGNNSTYVGDHSNNASYNRYLDVDSSAWNGKLSLRTYMYDVRNAIGYLDLYFLNASGETISTYHISQKGTVTNTYTIPVNTTLVRIYIRGITNFGYSCYVDLQEVTVTAPPKSLNSSRSLMRSAKPKIPVDNNPVINVNNNEVTIDYKDELTHEYSLDYGETWISYVGPFVLEENTTIIARSVDSEDKVVNASTYTVTSINKEETKEEETTTTTTTQPTTTTSVETTTTTVVTTEKVVDIPERRDEDEETNE